MDTKTNGRKTYLRQVDAEQEKILDELLDYLKGNNLAFYKLTERNEGAQRYVDVTVSIKLA
jgi:hypothetical protein